MLSPAHEDGGNGEPGRRIWVIIAVIITSSMTFYDRPEELDALDEDYLDADELEG